MKIHLKSKSCPFCHETDIEIKHKPFNSCGGEDGSHGYPTKIVCSACGAAGPEVYESDKKNFMKALDAWNYRRR